MNHVSLVVNHTAPHTTPVCAKIINISIIGWDLFIRVKLKIIEVVIIILISTEFILKKIVALEATDELILFSEVFMGTQFLIYKTNVLI